MITSGQVAVGTAQTFVCNVPSGACSFAFANVAAGTIYIGSVIGAGTVSTTNSFLLTAGQISPVFNSYPASPGGTIKAVTSTGTGTLSWMMSDTRGYPQPTPGTP